MQILDGSASGVMWKAWRLPLSYIPFRPHVLADGWDPRAVSHTVHVSIHLAECCSMGPHSHPACWPRNVECFNSLPIHDTFILMSWPCVHNWSCMHAERNEKNTSCTCQLIGKGKRENYVCSETPPTSIKEKETLWSDRDMHCTAT